MLTDDLPPKIGLSLSSARMLRLSLGSCRLCLRMYSQIFLVTSVRGRGWLPTTAASASSGCMGFMKPPALPPVFALLLGIDAPPLIVKSAPIRIRDDHRSRMYVCYYCS